MKKMIVCGIDPGFDGGISFLMNGINGDIKLLKTLVMPTFKEKNRKQLDILSILNLFQRFHPNFTMIEKVHSMPGQGIASTGRFMYNAGIIRGILIGMGLSHDLVTPQQWKKTMLCGTKKEKIDAIVKVLNIFPKAKLKRTERCKKYHDGMAESVLIGMYGFECLFLLLNKQ